MAVPAIRVLVLYRHSLFGLGLAQLLARHGALDVAVVDETDTCGLDDALQRGVDAIVFEEGGPLEPLELLERSRCALLVDVNIGSPESWSIRRNAVPTTPDRLLELIRESCAERAAI